MFQRGMLIALSVSIGACASAPEHLYMLQDAPSASATSGWNRPLVLVGPVTVPEIVDRPQLVVREGKYGVSINEQERWATPLKDSLPQVIATQLGERCPKARFGLMRQAETSEPSARLNVDFTRMDIDRALGVTVAANWTYRGGEKNIARTSQGRATINSAVFAEYVDAMQRAISAWAEDVSRQLPVCQ